MKIAICYYGLSYNLNSIQNSNANNLPTDYRSSWENHKTVLWEPNKVDVFVHSWKNPNENDINNKYNPKKSLFEQQIDFTEEANQINNDVNVYGHWQRHHILSRWNSTQKVVELKSQYEKENGFEYDLVMVSRFDSYYRGDWDFKSLNPTKFYFIGGWRGNYNEELPDVWFISNSKNINTLANLYTNIGDVFHENRYDSHKNIWGGHLIVRRHLARENLLSNSECYKHHETDNGILRT